MRVLLADDHRLMIAGIRRVLEDAEDIEIVGEANVGSQVLPLIGQVQPDVVLLDIRMPKMDGLTCLELIRKRYPKVKSIMLSVFSDPEHIQAAVQRGASGYIVKSINPQDLLSAIRQAAEGTVYHAVVSGAADSSAAGREAGLTEREMSVLAGVARGLTNDMIGKELWVTEQTVKYHLTSIYRKLNVSNRTEAMRYAFKHGLVENPLHESEG